MCHAVLRRCAPVLLLAAVAPPADARTVIGDAAALRRLENNSGMTLQWIGFETTKRGRVTVRTEGGTVHLSGAQQGAHGSGYVTIEGDVDTINAQSFTLRGRIAINDTPDKGRRCLRDGTFLFRATGQRRYWRLQQMEAYDGLTDYVDIYFR